MILARFIYIKCTITRSTKKRKDSRISHIIKQITQRNMATSDIYTIAFFYRKYSSD